MEPDDFESTPKSRLGRMMEAKRIAGRIEGLMEDSNDGTAELSDSHALLCEYVKVQRDAIGNDDRVFPWEAHHVDGHVYDTRDYGPDGAARGYKAVVHNTGGWMFVYTVTRDKSECWVDDSYRSTTGEQYENDAWLPPTADTFRIAANNIAIADGVPDEIREAFENVGPDSLQKSPY